MRSVVVVGILAVVMVVSIVVTESVAGVWPLSFVAAVALGWNGPFFGGSPR